MNFMMKLIGISILSAVSCSAANAHVSVSIGLPLPVIYSAPTYSYGCGHVGEPPCSYSSGSYWGPSVTVAPLGVYYDPWYWYDRGPRYYHHHHHHHHGYGHPPRHGFHPGPGHHPHHGPGHFHGARIGGPGHHSIGHMHGVRHGGPVHFGGGHHGGHHRH